MAQHALILDLPWYVRTTSELLGQTSVSGVMASSDTIANSQGQRRRGGRRRRSRNGNQSSTESRAMQFATVTAPETEDTATVEANIVFTAVAVTLPLAILSA